MKIYTKAGDKGYTTLFEGVMVPKNDPRIEAYGTIDELNSWIGLIRVQDIDKHDKHFLLDVQDNLMILSSQIANGTKALKDLAILNEKNIDRIEKEIDRIEKLLPPLTTFIIPGGNTLSSYCHITRTVCRRAERRLVPLLREKEDQVIFMKFLNRLSDYLFMLCRKISKDFNAEEIVWKPGM